MKDGICTAIGVVGSTIASFFGGFDAALITLLIFMGVDYATGLIVAGVFHKSEKTENGALESRAGWKGLCRKGISLLIVLVAYRLDLIAGTDFICNAVMAAYLVNELLSITENLGLMGVPVPKVLTSAIDLLRQKSEAQETNKMQRAKGEFVEAGEKEQKHQEREY